jgi:hypothetical protein
VDFQTPLKFEIPTGVDEELGQAWLEAVSSEGSLDLDTMKEEDLREGIIFSLGDPILEVGDGDFLLNPNQLATIWETMVKLDAKGLPTKYFDPCENNYGVDLDSYADEFARVHLDSDGLEDLHDSYEKGLKLSPVVVERNQAAKQLGYLVNKIAKTTGVSVQYLSYLAMLTKMEEQGARQDRLVRLFERDVFLSTKYVAEALGLIAPDSDSFSYVVMEEDCVTYLPYNSSMTDKYLIRHFPTYELPRRLTHIRRYREEPVFKKDYLSLASQIPDIQFLLEVLEPVVGWEKKLPELTPKEQVMNFFGKEYTYEDKKIWFCPIGFNIPSQVIGAYKSYYNALCGLEQMEELEPLLNLSLYLIGNEFYLAKIDPDYNFPFMDEIYVWVQYLQKTRSPILVSQMEKGKDWSNLDQQEAKWERLLKSFTFSDLVIGPPLYIDSNGGSNSAQLYRSHFAGVKFEIKDNFLLASAGDLHFLENHEIQGMFWTHLGNTLGCEINWSWFKNVVKNLRHQNPVLKKPVSCTELLDILSFAMVEETPAWLDSGFSLREIMLYCVVKYQAQLLTFSGGRMSPKGKVVLKKL